MSLESNKTRKIICQEKVCHVCCFVDRSSGWTMLHRKRRVIIWQSTFNAVRTIFFPFATPPMSVMRWVMRNRNPGHGYTLCRNDAIQDIHQKILAGGWGSSRQTSIKWCTNSGWYNYIQLPPVKVVYPEKKTSAMFWCCQRSFAFPCLQARNEDPAVEHQVLHLVLAGTCESTPQPDASAFQRTLLAESRCPSATNGIPKPSDMRRSEKPLGHIEPNHFIHWEKV